jgi:hypothetical protein
MQRILPVKRQLLRIGAADGDGLNLPARYAFVLRIRKADDGVH